MAGNVLVILQPSPTSSAELARPVQPSLALLSLRPVPWGHLRPSRGSGRVARRWGSPLGCDAPQRADGSVGGLCRPQGGRVLARAGLRAAPPPLIPPQAHQPGLGSTWPSQARPVGLAPEGVSPPAHSRRRPAGLSAYSSCTPISPGAALGRPEPLGILRIRWCILRLRRLRRWETK